MVNTSKNPEKAAAFLDFVHTAAAQKIFGEHGYRPTLKSAAAEFDFPTPPELFTIDDLGGWQTVKKEFFDPDTGSVTKIFQGQGIATG